jgi:NADH-quinone oxidoreductase subunit N
MNSWMNILPEAILSVSALIILVISTLAGSVSMRDLLRWLSAFAIAGSAVALVFNAGTPGLSTGGWVNSTQFTTSIALVLLSLIGFAVLTSPVPSEGAGEWFALLLFTALGSVVLSRVGNLAAVFLGIEVLSVSIYVLVSFRYVSRLSLRGGVTYLILAGVGSAFLVFGMALIFAAYGTLGIAELESLATGKAMPLLGLFGYGMFLVGIGFKLAATPFHMWAPDVYEAAPTSAAGIIASASKGAGMAALLPFAFLLKSHFLVLALLSGGSMIIGNLLGLRETRVKRILAYSSIAHVGYLLLGFIAIRSATPAALAQNMDAWSAVVFYIAVYGISVLGAFTAIGALRTQTVVSLNDLHGLGRTRPVVSACLLVFTVSLAGLPLSIGFWGKIYLFSAAFQAGLVKLAVLGLIGSAIGLFYYMRILVHLYMVSPEMNPRGPVPEHSSFQTALLIASAAAVVVFSFFPDFLYYLVRGGH